MIELRDVVAVAGMKPLSCSMRRGDVIALDGPPELVSALTEVISGARAPLHGERSCLDGPVKAVMVRATDPRDAAWLDCYRHAWSLAPLRRSASSSAAAVASRGRLCGARLWVVNGELSPAAEEEVQRVAEEMRTGDGVVVWTAGGGGAARRRSDKTLRVESESRALSSLLPAFSRRSTSRPASRVNWAALTRCWATRAALRPATGGALAAAAAVVALLLWTSSAYAGYWYQASGLDGLELAARGAAAVIALLSSVSAVAGLATDTEALALADTPLGSRGARLLAVLGAVVVAAAASLALVPVAAWSYRAGALEGTAATALLAAPVTSAVVAATAVATNPRSQVAIVSGVLLGGAAGAFLSGFGLLW